MSKKYERIFITLTDADVKKLIDGHLVNIDGNESSMPVTIGTEKGYREFIDFVDFREGKNDA